MERHYIETEERYEEWGGEGWEGVNESNGRFIIFNFDIVHDDIEVVTLTKLCRLQRI